jgi:hypothetical protein
MGKARMSSSLGRGAILGGMVPGRQHRFCLVLGPLDIETYHRFSAHDVTLPQRLADGKINYGRTHSTAFRSSAGKCAVAVLTFPLLSLPFLDADRNNGLLSSPAS